MPPASASAVWTARARPHARTLAWGGQPCAKRMRTVLKGRRVVLVIPVIARCSPCALMGPHALAATASGLRGPTSTERATGALRKARERTMPEYLSPGVYI